MGINFKDTTPEEVMAKYPRITAHLIAESLGYFTPKRAAMAIIKAKNNEPFFCEWYSDCARKYGDMWDRENVQKVTKEILRQAISYRHTHEGCMASYKQAKQIVYKAIKGNEPTLASWF